MPAAPSNTITTQDVCTALDQEFVANFDQSVNQLTDILGIVSPEIVAAGTALYKYVVTGTLNDAADEDGSSGDAYIEGDLVALSKYSVAKEPVGDTAFKPYRKVTTAQAIGKSGFENAVVKTDNKLLKDIRAAILAYFYGRLAEGTGTATGRNLQAALAQTDAALMGALEANNDSASRIIHWVNRFDVADYLSDAQVSMQTAFGMTYLESFLGIENVIVTGSVPKGTVYATPDENLHLYGVDFGSLGSAGLVYEVSDSGLIGVHHEPVYNRTSVETNVLTGAYLMPEVMNYIVKGTLVPEVSTGA